MKSFFRFFAKRHILATLITIMTILLGLHTLMGIKRDIYPQVDFGLMSIITRYPGASPEDVELNVTNNIEEELKSVEGIDKVTSISMENVSLIQAFIDMDVKDQKKVKDDIREAVGRVTDFPGDVTESPFIQELNSTNSEVIEVGLTGNIPYRELREHARLFEKKLKNISGVSRLEKYGYRAQEIKVEVAPRAVEKYQIPLREIIGAIKGRNIRGTAGSFESYTSEKNLVTLAQFRDPQEVGDVIVRSTFDGPMVRVRDLAIVKEDFEDEKVLSRINGKTAISFLVFLGKSADGIRTCDAVKKLVEKENKHLPENVKLLYSNDTSRIVRKSFKVVITNGIIGLILVVIVLAVFLNIRTAFWVAMGIPVAMMGTFFLLPLFGVYLDTITLSGIILVIGIIVDDAIIIAENVFRRREMGDAPLDAAVEGISEVFRPVLTTVFTTILVFAPMFFMPGIFGKYVMVIPLGISIALFVSLGEAMVALPAHLLPGLRGNGTKSAGHSWFNAVRDRYRSLMTLVLKLRYVFVIVFVIFLAGSFWYAKNFMKFNLFPADDAQEFFLVIELPTGTSLISTSNKVKEIEEFIAELAEQELASFITRIGQNVLINAESENYAAIRVVLTPYSERDRTADQIVEHLRLKTDKLDGFNKVLYHVVSGGPPVGKPINIQVVGSDDAIRTQLADTVEASLSAIKGVKDITRDDKGGKDQIEIKIDFDKLSRLGLTVADVAQNVRIAYDGEVVTSVRYGDEDINFRVLIEEKSRKQLKPLKKLLIPNRQGRLIPLKNVAKLEAGPGKSDYRHFNGERTITIEADLNQEITTTMEASEILFGNIDLDKDWPGMQLLKGGEVIETEESMAGLYRTLIIAILGVYFLLVLLFNSLTQPFLVMLAMPFGITGVIVAFGLHGMPLSFMGTMGIIGLCGVVVNDSLVLVNHINDLKQERPDEPVKQLVAEGTANRLRAIIMTTLTTVAALLPLAYGIGGTATFMGPMAMAMGWGLVFATPLTLVLVPSFFVIGLDIKGVIKRK